MDLGQQSNLGSLISAVLVGLLALASNQYARMDRQALKSFVNNISVSRFVDRDQDDTEQTIEQLADATEIRINKIESRFSGIFEQWKEGRISADDPKLKPLWKGVQKLRDSLEDDDELRNALSSRAHVNYVWIMFRAAEMNPEKFSNAFISISDGLADEDDETIRAQAAVLRIYHGYDPRKPDVVSLNDKLEAFAKENTDLGVFLYLVVARELFDVGSRDVAAVVLRRGIQVYSKYPSNLGRIKLINELMDQQMGH